MPQHTVEAVEVKKQLEATPDRKAATIYRLVVKSPEGQSVPCELYQLSTTPAPTIGAQLDGTIEPSSNPEYLPSFKKPKGNFGGGGGGGDWSPERTAAVQRQHSQEMAIRFLVATGKLHPGMADQPSSEVLGRVETIAKWFDADIKEAADKAKGQASSGSNGQGGAPAQGSPVTPAQQPPNQPPPIDQAAVAGAAMQAAAEQGDPPPPKDDDIPF